MIRSLTVTNHNHDSLTLELYNPEKSGLIIDNIEGLGPPTASINSDEVAMVDGGIFTSARMTQRNIVLTLSMMFDPIVEDSRLKTYKFFQAKKPVHLVIKTDRRNAECDGYVESNTPTVFTQHEQTQISIICPDPFFYELGAEKVAFSGVHPMFEFPFWNDSLTEDLLEFGDIRYDNRAVINYIGDADTGVFMVAHVMYGTVENFTIWNVNTRERIKIDTKKIIRMTGITFGAGDDIEINTKIGEKYVRLLHDGQYYNIISCVNKDADWFQLTSGQNTFTFTADYGENNMSVTFNYRNAYGGI